VLVTQAEADAASNLGCSDHFETVTKPVPSPVKMSPPGPFSIDLTSRLANSLPLSEKL
jgi:hypothetical protein